ncbi:fibronectin type III domain-containing protein [Shouchella lehensis]|uniref:Invasin/intimin cell-adhesion protein n=1 Tax=Shouchella lehensis G1 TaxID=1246626 RepID=A0A060M098_9BACI|nr:fibronectin type III domain-containing protein [Shouchella lehensis]AIC95445.1 Invasin/intimin cell-adhesion protein [Shouchella lehensis G1]
MPTYNVYRNGEQVANGLTEKTYTDTDVQPNTAYEYQVSAENEVGESELSEPIEVETDRIPVDSISATPTTATIAPEETQHIDVTVSPDDASEKGVSYSSSDASVATVRTGTITGVTAGTATITVTSKDDSSKRATVEVTVVEPEEPEDAE